VAVVVVVCRYAKEVCDAIVAKCLTGRPKTVEKAQAAFMLWVELEAVDVFLVSDFMVFGKE
jgi:cytoskeleton-associated protein 5